MLIYCMFGSIECVFLIVVNVVFLNGFKLWIVIDVEYKMAMGMKLYWLVDSEWILWGVWLLNSW